jgi:hypothetical protein
MNQAKLSRAEQGLNGIAKRVLAAVPIAELWSRQQVMAELRRTGCAAETNYVEGCLDALRGRGLVREPERGRFQRVVARAAVLQVLEETDMAVADAKSTTPAAAASAGGLDPLTRLATLAAAARRLANEIEEVALEAEARLDEFRADAEKLRTLQGLLKSAGA